MFSELEKLLKEADVIKGAPRSFTLVCIVAVAGIWAGFHYEYKGKLDEANERTTNARTDTTHWHDTADYWKDLATRPVQHEISAPETTSAASKADSTKKPEQKPEQKRKPADATSTTKPETTGGPTVTAPGGIAIGRDNTGTAIVNNVGSLPRVLSAAQKTAIASHIGDEPSNFVGITCLLGDQEGCGLANQLMEALRSAGWKIDGINQSIYSNRLEGIFVSVGTKDSDPDGVLKVYNVLRHADVPVQGLKLNDMPAGKFGIVIGAHPITP